MLLKLLLLFTLIPLLELAILIEIGRRIGTAETLVLILGTGALGAYLARRQGLGVLQRIREEIAAGRPPTHTVVDGVIILVAAALLITPGVLTDVLGFLCLVPATRRAIKSLLWRAFTRAIGRGRAQVIDVQTDNWPIDR